MSGFPVLIWFVYPKLISEKWNLAAKFHCLDAHYFATQKYRSVPMCATKY